MASDIGGYAPEVDPRYKSTGLPGASDETERFEWVSRWRPWAGTVKLTDLRTYSASWTLPKLLNLSSSSDRFLLQTPRIPLNLNIPVELSSVFFMSGSRSRGSQ